MVYLYMSFQLDESLFPEAVEQRRRREGVSRKFKPTTNSTRNLVVGKNRKHGRTDGPELHHGAFQLGFTTMARDIVRTKKTEILDILCGDYTLILNKVEEKKLITRREYNNLKSINREDVYGHVVQLVDKIMNKGEETCTQFLRILQTDEEIKSTFPELENIQLNQNHLLSEPVQASSKDISDTSSLECNRQKQDEQYQLNSQPVGLCVIINNENFENGNVRLGTDKDTQSLSEVFSWLGFRVLMCKDQTKDQMDRALNCFASLSGDLSQLQELNVKEWSHAGFAELQQPLKHGDAFICCILSHGIKGAVLGTDRQPLCIKQITTTFKATAQSALTGKPKVFLIQACQGRCKQHGVMLKDVEADDSPPLSIPEEADVLVALSTVEDYASFRNITDGSWFIQSVCQQLHEGCQRGEDITTILHRVNSDVSRKEGSSQVGAIKQMPEVRFTLRKKLVLSSPSN
ncbi:hypothetical protein Q5P01_022079 [Channa striata]|uniref:Caspase-8 n=1 Tax=Channa striata TaxID=64152 RepID=A0AA88LPJ9_CHASR|nr:hypothetical protein Q5P01_022079 [Channa striata]